jgi:hypothetical protein
LKLVALLLFTSWSLCCIYEQSGNHMILTSVPQMWAQNDAVVSECYQKMITKRNRFENTVMLESCMLARLLWQGHRLTIAAAKISWLAFWWSFFTICTLATIMTFLLQLVNKPKFSNKFIFQHEWSNKTVV